MRICFLAGADSVHTQRWVQFFIERGHHVLVLSQRAAPEGALPAEVVRVLGPARGPLPLALARYVLSVRAQIREFAPDLVHAHYVAIYGIIGALCGRRPFVLTPWGSDVLIESNESMLQGAAVRFALRAADQLTTDGEHLFPTLRRLGAPMDRVEIIHFGTDTERFTPAARDRTVFAPLGWAVDDFVVISLRHLSPVYDVETLIRAVPAVLGRVPRARFFVAGQGDSRPELEALAAGLGVASHVHFAGAVPPDALPRYLASADVYVSTSRSDGGLASSTAEAMACARPAVITDFGDNGKWVQDGVQGFLVPLSSPDRLAERIVRLATDPALAARAGALGRKVIQERNDRNVEMEKAESLYRRLLGSRSG